MCAGSVHTDLNADITCDCYATGRKYLEASSWRFQPIRYTRMQFWLIAVTQSYTSYQPVYLQCQFCRFWYFWIRSKDICRSKSYIKLVTSLMKLNAKINYEFSLGASKCASLATSSHLALQSSMIYWCMVTTQRPNHVMFNRNHCNYHTSLMFIMLTCTSALLQLQTVTVLHKFSLYYVHTSIIIIITRKPSWRKGDAWQQCVYEGP